MCRLLSYESDQALWVDETRMTQELTEFRVRIDDTNVFIKTDSNKAALRALKSIRMSRLEVEKYVLKHSDFMKTFEPIQVSPDSPEVIKRMANAAKSAGVGPMAAVAGAISDLAVETMIEEGANIAVVENGGEISAISVDELNIALYAGASSISGKLGLRIYPKETPIGIGTSSATIGSALSLGDADAATIVAENAALGDAVSTLLCNEVKSNNLMASMKESLEIAKGIKGVRGGIVVQGDYIGLVGKIPQIISVEGFQGIQ